MKAKFKIVGGNSGIQYRSKYVDKPEYFHIGGYQADIDGAKDDGYTGILLRRARPGHHLQPRHQDLFIDEDGTRYE